MFGASGGLDGGGLHGGGVVQLGGWRLQGGAQAGVVQPGCAPDVGETPNANSSSIASGRYRFMVHPKNNGVTIRDFGKSESSDK